jgi:AGZA family xanthine/uracil permease-like MFS transporter
VGALMFRSIRELPTESLEELVPAFLTLVLIPLTFSITQGLLWGFISHVGLYLLTGRRKELHPILVLLAVIAIGLLTFEHGIKTEF